MDIRFNVNKISSKSAVYKAYIRLANSLSNDTPNVFEKYDSSLKKADYIVCANIWQILKTCQHTLGSKTKIIFWVQGVVAEESYLKNGSKIKFNILKAIENICLKLSDAYIYVSPFMKDYYSKNKATNNKPYLIFPCISDLTYNSKPKTPNSFCYLGGMAKWQNFPTIVKMMNEINTIKPNSIFKIATPEIDTCQTILNKAATPELKNKIQICTLHTKKEVENFLSDCEYGFLIRDDILVNQVSSPIKLAEYLSCGVNVITTPAIRSYTPLLKQAGIIVVPNQDLTNQEFNANTQFALDLYLKLFSKQAVDNNVKDFLQSL